MDTSDTQNEDGTTTALTDEEKQAKKDQAQAVLDKLQASEDPASADMDALAKEVNEDLSAVDNTFDDEDTLLAVSYTHLDVYKRQARCWMRR